MLDTQFQVPLLSPPVCCGYDSNGKAFISSSFLIPKNNNNIIFSYHFKCHLGANLLCNLYFTPTRWFDLFLSF